MANSYHSKTYKKALRDAEILYQQSPQHLQMLIDQNQVSSIERRAFEDFLNKRLIEQDLSKNHSRRALLQKYGARFLRYKAGFKQDRDQSKDR
ncbi:MAG: hypothetical protein R8G66_02785 [Cytophagales bacterium]|nr:hypothetical protein [Cytophagales bacterium]